MAEKYNFNPEQNNFPENWHMNAERISTFISELNQNKYSLTQLDKIEEDLNKILGKLLEGSPLNYPKETELERENLNKILTEIFIYKNDRSTDIIDHTHTIN